eukprot:UN16801
MDRIFDSLDQIYEIKRNCVRICKLV